MNKISFVGDGKTKDFYFTFPFFDKNNVVVELNGEPATNFGVQCQSGGMNADIPFSGGMVRFAKAPPVATVITIYRNLELKRHVDYQTTSRLTPMMLNQDMNFMLEILKDMKNELVGFADSYSEITDKESTDVLLNKINAVTSEIDNVVSEISTVRQEIEDLGDMQSIHSSIESLNNSVVALNSAITNANSNISGLHNFKNGVLDYVVESQMPTSSNNYTWYRKYKSGWVEQGAGALILGGDAIVINLSVPMSSINYNILLSQFNSDTTAPNLNRLSFYNQNTTSFTVISRYTNSNVARSFLWQVCGMAA